MKGFDSMTSGVWRALLGTGFALTLVNGAMGQTTTESDTDKPDEWRFTLAPLYLWFAGIEGDAGIGPVTAPVNIKFGDVLDNLSGVFTFHFEAGKRKWNIFADYMYLELEPGATGPMGTPVSATVRNNIAELGGTYRVRDAAPWVEVLGGLRYTDLSMGVSPAPPVDIEESWWDGFGGVRLGHEFGSKKQWSVKARADVGAGGSDLTWSAYMLAGWQFTKWGSLNAGYKWLGYDYETGSGASRFSWDVTYQGPIAGLVFNW